MLVVGVSQESSEGNIFYMLRRNGFENSLKNSIPTGSKNLFIAGGVVTNKQESTWKYEA
jgi:hypothetical protein